MTEIIWPLVALIYGGVMALIARGAFASRKISSTETELDHIEIETYHEDI